MRVLLTGVTGYIGSAVAAALKRDGHEVRGVVRSDEAAERISRLGYEPLLCDLRDTMKLTGLAYESEAVIHTAASRADDAATVDANAIWAMATTIKGTDRPLIYTSGIWVIGDTGDRIADEQSPTLPPATVSIRADQEQRLIVNAQTGVRTIIIRPALVYGRGGGIPAMLIHDALARGAVRVIGRGEQRWSVVHVDDLADLYSRALSDAPPGSLYNVTADRPYTMREIAVHISQSFGLGGRPEECELSDLTAEWGPLAEGLALDQQVSAEKARAELKWEPRGSTILEEIATGSYAELVPV